MRERLKADPSQVLIKYINMPRLEADSKRSFENMGRLNLAHALMLKKQNIISESDAHAILNALLELQQKGPDAIELNPNFEDYYFNTERYIISQIGIETGGKMHTARSRNDLHSTILRMNVRDSILNIFSSFMKLRSELLICAQQHSKAVITGYTHMQPAQPITLGFYFSAVAEALERDFDRLALSYRHLNKATLGACAFAGTSFNIDRKYTAELLGFDDFLVNTLDAVATRDYILELISGFAIMASTINRMVHDLYYWSTDEFGYIEMDDSMCGTSSIMPQKKNPSVLEYIKAKCSHQLAAYVDSFCSMRGVPFGHNRDTGGESIHLLWDAFSEMEAMLELTGEVLRTMKVKKEHLKQRADLNYCTVTDLADELVCTEGLSFRTAHQIVGHVVMECVDKGLVAADITPEQLDIAGQLYAGRPFGWSKVHLHSVLDAEQSINKRKSAGSPSPEQCTGMISEMKERLAQDEAWVRQALANMEAADQRLMSEVQKAL
jgi:argininosuccinate lyase